MKQSATFDSSFWINLSAAGLVDALLEDFDLWVVPAVVSEFAEPYPSGGHLHQLIADDRIRVEAPPRSVLERFGAGERAAMSLAAEHRGWTLLLDDVRPFHAAQEMGLHAVCSPAYAVSLYERGMLDDSGILSVFARLAARSTVSPQLLALGLRQMATILRERG